MTTQKSKRKESIRMNDILETIQSQPLQDLKRYDLFSYQHSLRVGDMVQEVIRPFGLPNEQELVKGAYLHDVGKLFVPTRILNKKGKLDGNEWEYMKSHASFGGQYLRFLGYSDDIVETAIYHHERLDGTGYHQRDRIPFGVQIVSICDTFVAMTEDRVYQNGRTPDSAWEILLSETEQFSKILVSDIRTIWLNNR